jgi:hypothetical protein
MGYMKTMENIKLSEMTDKALIRYAKGIIHNDTHTLLYEIVSRFEKSIGEGEKNKKSPQKWGLFV